MIRLYLIVMAVILAAVAFAGEAPKYNFHWPEVIAEIPWQPLEFQVDETIDTVWVIERDRLIDFSRGDPVANAEAKVNKLDAVAEQIRKKLEARKKKQ